MTVASVNAWGAQKSVTLCHDTYGQTVIKRRFFNVLDMPLVIIQYTLMNLHFSCIRAAYRSRTLRKFIYIHTYIVQIYLCVKASKSAFS